MCVCGCFLSFLPSVIQTGWLVLHRDVTISHWENQTPPSAFCSHLGLYKFGPVVLHRFNESSVTSKASADSPLPPFSLSPAFDLLLCKAQYSLPGVEFCVIYFVLRMCSWDLECDQVYETYNPPFSSSLECFSQGTCTWLCFHIVKRLCQDNAVHFYQGHLPTWLTCFRTRSITITAFNGKPRLLFCFLRACSLTYISFPCV